MKKLTGTTKRLVSLIVPPFVNKKNTKNTIENQS